MNMLKTISIKPILDMPHRHLDVAYRLRLEKGWSNEKIKKRVLKYCEYRNMTTTEKAAVDEFVQHLNIKPEQYIYLILPEWTYHQVQYFLACMHLWDNKGCVVLKVRVPHMYDNYVVYKFYTHSHPEVDGIKRLMLWDLGDHNFTYAEFNLDANLNNIVENL